MKNICMAGTRSNAWDSFERIMQYSIYIILLMCAISQTMNQDLLCNKQIVDEIATNGFVIINDFLSPAIIAALANEAKMLQAKGMMHEATTGQSSTTLSETNSSLKLRGDSTCWIDESQPSDALKVYLAATQAIQQSLNLALFLGLYELESHFAIYPIGSRYHKHLDQFHHDQSRKVSCILYLNQAWEATEGGELRMYLDKTEHDDFIDISPIGGRLVLFLSDRFLHEVLPAKRERISITGWFRTRSNSLPI